MSASENQAAQTSKGTDDMKVDRPWNIVHIRLPPKKRLPDASLILSKKVPRNNTESKEVPEPITDNLGKNLITAPLEGEANIHSPRAGLCNEAHSNIMSKTLSAESESDTSGDKLLDEVSILSKNLRVAAEEQGSDVGSYSAKQGLCEETNNNNPSMVLPLLVQELPEDNIDSSQSPRVGLCDGTISNILSQTQSVESQSDTSGDKVLNGANDCTLSKNLRVAAEEQGGDASSYAGLSDEANNNIPSMTIPLPDQELPEGHIDNGRSKSITTTGKQSTDEHNKSPRKELLYDNESKAEEEEGNYPNWNPTITTVKYEKMFAEANHPIPCKKLSADAKNNRPSKRPTDSANKRNESVYKRRRTSSVQATGTSKNTPGMKLSASVGQAVEQSTNAANMDVIKVYQEFETKNKGTVYLDNLSHQATESKTNRSRTLSATVIEHEVFEHANHPIPTKKLSGMARNMAPSNRPTDPAKKNNPRKRPRTSAVQATDTSENASAMKLATSDGEAVNQSNKSAADLEAIKQYQEFKEKVKRTVYLDNLSPQATEAVIRAALSQFCTIRKVSFVVNYTIPYDIPQSAFVEMETEKDAEAVVSMLQGFPFMMSGMPRPVRAIHATAEMFNDRPRKPGSKLEFRWVRYPDRDYETIKKLKLLSRKHEVENFALIEHELEEEKLLAVKQQEDLNCNYKMMETMDSVLLSGMSSYISKIYNVSWNDVF
uniref:Uncharacterized protein n=1 Tax=Avena sativa TaxID=4498 RepID=A0ACD5YEE1_AVESA